MQAQCITGNSALRSTLIGFGDERRTAYRQRQESRELFSIYEYRWRASLDIRMGKGDVRMCLSTVNVNYELYHWGYLRKKESNVELGRIR